MAVVGLITTTHFDLSFDWHSVIASRPMITVHEMISRDGRPILTHEINPTQTAETSSSL